MNQKLRLLTILLIVGFSMFSTSKAYTQNTYIPDDNFEQNLIDKGYDSGPLNDSVPTANINGIVTLNLHSKNISDLTGIEDFVALEKLICAFNLLTSLDVSANTALTELYCGVNELTSLNVSNNTALTILSCYSNNLTSIDISNCTALEKLTCRKNELTSLNVTENTALTLLSCYDNNLANLDVSANTALTNLNCSFNQLISLDVSTNTALIDLNCMANQIASLDVSENTALTKLTCSHNQLTNIDVSSNMALKSLNVYRNELTNLNLSTNIALEYLNCGYTGLISLDASTCTNLKELHTEDNNLTSLDVSANTDLTILKCRQNDMANLNVSTNTSLIELECYGNQLTNLDVSENVNLKLLNCSANKLTSLDLSANTALTRIECQYTPLTSVDIRNGNNANITYFNASDNIDLTCIYVDDKDAAYLSDWVKDESSNFVNDETECELLNNSAPSDITLSDSSIDEGVAPGTVVGTLTATDEDTADTHTFSLVTGDGTNDAGNSFFTIEDDVLKSNEEFDYETQTEYNIYVKAEDAGELSFEKAFIISVNDVIETGISDINENKISTYPSPVKNNLTIQTPEENSYKIDIYDITGQLKVTKTFNSQKFSIDLSNIKAGIYILSVSYGNEKVTKKILKQ